MAQPLTILNADVWNGQTFERRDLHMSDAIRDRPARNSIPIDLSGVKIFPAFINAHDHLELNHYPRTKFRERYDNAHQWGEDVNRHLDEEPFKTLRSHPLEDRCFIGGLKNLLCGALTVVHHNPPHKPLFRRDFPVTVLKHYGWVHSLHFNTEAEVVTSYRRTPPDVPWFIHLAEGTDEIAAGEYQRLDALCCISKNTFLVHGVRIPSNFASEKWYRRQEPIGTLVWCPSTNLYLLGETTDAVWWQRSGGVVLVGSDSRLTADGDFLDEFANPTSPLNKQYRQLCATPYEHFRVPETAAALGMNDVGSLDTGKRADWIAVSDDLTRRKDIRLIVRRGVPQIGDPDLMAQFPHVDTVRAELDGVPKAINMQLARQIARCSLQEPGLELIDNPQGRRRTLW